MTEAHDLQEFLWPMAGMPSQLYAGAASGGEVTAEGHLKLSEGEGIHGDSYFNAFFPAIWQEYAGLGRIGVRCKGRGRLSLRLNGHHADGSKHVLTSWSHSGDPEESLHWVWDQSDDAGIQRLSVDLCAEGGPAVLESVAFVGDHAPRRDVSLCIGIVTHDREALLERTLAEIARVACDLPELRRVVIVNQGDSFRHKDLCDRIEAPLFKVMRQPNLGGCGGFARAMVEAMDDSDQPTHLILMDDDILLDGRMLRRAILFAGQTVDPVVLGAQALELERPRRLQEAWGELGPFWQPMLKGTGQDMSAPEQLALWAGVPRPDYNGWWFCMMPVAAIRAVGLPTPIFIRGDDIEYGLRLRQGGWPIVALPGLAVWHASVHYKHVGLVQYYEQRNLLVAAASHPETAEMPPAMAVLGRAVHHLLVHRYRAAAANIAAIADFLAGPAVALGSCSADRHREIVRSLDHIPLPERVETADTRGMARPQGFVPFRSAQITTLHAVRLVMRVLLTANRKPIRVLQIGAPDPLAIGARPYLLAADAKAAASLVMHPRRWVFLRLLISALWFSLCYAFCHRAAARRWREALGTLRSRERWAQEFGPDPDLP